MTGPLKSLTTLQTDERATIMQEWVDALLSGQYIQGTGVLHSPAHAAARIPDSYCCLGVLCEVMAKHNYMRPLIGGEYEFIVEDPYNDEFCEQAITSELGPSKPYLHIEDIEEKDLIEMNDGKIISEKNAQETRTQSCTFEEIAQHIVNRILPKILTEAK